MHTHVRIHTQQTRAHTHVHAYARTHTHTHTHTHTQDVLTSLLLHYRKREILRRLKRAIVELLSKLNGRRDDLIDVTTRAGNLRDKVGKDVDIVLYTPGLRRRFADIMGVDTDLTKLPGWPEGGGYADRLNAYVGSQQASGGQELSFGFQSGQSCMMCPSQIPCTQAKEGLLMVCHCKHPPAEAQTKDK